MQTINPITRDPIISIEEINATVATNDADGILLDVYIDKNSDIRIAGRYSSNFIGNFNEYNGTVVYRFINGTKLNSEIVEKIGILLAKVKLTGPIIVASSCASRSDLDDLADVIYDHRDVKSPVHVASENKVSDTSDAYSDGMYSYTTPATTPDEIFMRRVLSYLTRGIPVLIDWANNTYEFAERAQESELLTVVNRGAYIRKMESR